MLWGICLAFFLSLARDLTPYESLIDQFKLFCLTFAVVFMSLVVVQGKILSYACVLRTLVWSHFCYMICKIGIVALYFSGFLKLDFFLSVLGIRYVTMAIVGDLSRLQTSVDLLTPFLLFFVLHSARLNVHFSRVYCIAYVVATLFSIFLSFSRFLIGVTLFSLISYLLLLSPLQRFRWTVGVCIILFIGILIGGVSLLSPIIERRLFSEASYDSDSTRIEQIQALMDSFSLYPILGKGMGSYVDEMIRDPIHRHSYEVQWVAFLMQLGLIGLGALLVMAAVLFYQLITIQPVLLGYSLGGLYVLWLCAGLTNPFLISLPSGVLYALFATTAWHLHFRTINSHEEEVLSQNPAKELSLWQSH